MNAPRPPQHIYFLRAANCSALSAMAKSVVAISRACLGRKCAVADPAVSSTEIDIVPCTSFRPVGRASMRMVPSTHSWVSILIAGSARNAVALIFGFVDAFFMQFTPASDRAYCIDPTLSRVYARKKRPTGGRAANVRSLPAGCKKFRPISDPSA